ncbi:hypothetical protein EOK75_01700 [Pseudorhodobacter turbinis]|uniref:Uncharacterized protein n=1 Tax=Pseudorhodobacter turbinis TaxID=2500533 RepID=A0A4P8ECZ1_9RHOB|nr:hypothetical protein [Pseudorhodobacter turbinis]QCO54636.1 hypothetical protein EOK75_01700 [Pseudorhodobacter turbinis]
MTTIIARLGTEDLAEDGGFRGSVIYIRSVVRKILTFILSSILFVIVIAVVGEFFIEVAKAKGWYENAGQTWDRFMGVITDFASSNTALYPLIGLGGLVAGLWLDFLLAHVDRVRLAGAGKFDLRFIRQNLDVVKYFTFSPQKKNEVETALSNITSYRRFMSGNQDIQNVLDIFVQAIGLAEISAQRQPTIKQRQDDGKWHFISKHELVRQMCDSLYEVCENPSLCDPVALEDENGICWMPPVIREATVIISGAA